MTKQIRELVDALLIHSARLAAWADDPDEDSLSATDQTIAAELSAIHKSMTELLGTWDQGKLLRDGIETVIVGKPNVGKSTLMNLLSGQQRSIVTDVPGTTRDVVEDQIRLGDLVLRIADTAGIRKTEDPVERIGVDRAKEKLETAQLVLAVFDSADKLTDDDQALLDSLRGRPCIAVINKIDLPRQLDLERIQSAIPHVVLISAKEGKEQAELEKAVAVLLRLKRLDPTAAMVHSERQLRNLRQAADSVMEAACAVRSGITLDAVSVSIDCALDALLSLTGERATDAVVDEVFSRFCVGK